MHVLNGATNHEGEIVIELHISGSVTGNSQDSEIQ